MLKRQFQSYLFYTIVWLLYIWKTKLNYFHCHRSAFLNYFSPECHPTDFLCREWRRWSSWLVEKFNPRWTRGWLSNPRQRSRFIFHLWWPHVWRLLCWCWATMSGNGTNMSLSWPVIGHLSTKLVTSKHIIEVGRSNFKFILQTHLSGL